MKVLIATLTAVAMLGAPAMANPPKDGETFGSWQVVCEGGKPCQAFLGLKDQKSGRLILSASAHRAPADRNATLVLSLPLGLSLKDGVALVSSAAGREAIPARLDVCFPDGCRAVIELTPETLDTLAARADFEVRFIAYGADDRVESVKVPSDGLKDAVARLARK